MLYDEYEILFSQPVERRYTSDSSSSQQFGRSPL